MTTTAQARQWLGDLRAMLHERKQLTNRIGLKRCAYAGHDAHIQSSSPIPCPHCGAAI